MNFLLFHTLLWTIATASHCRLTPQSHRWPRKTKWQALSSSLDGRLIKSTPPAAVCHADQPTFDAEVCNATDWTSATTYAEDPVGAVNPNWANDSCLSQPIYHCSGDGFPIYVVNASTPEHVAAGINFVREHNIRLNVKGSGHDYLGSLGFKRVGACTVECGLMVPSR